MYIHTALLNGRRLTKPVIEHAVLMKPGKLVLEMSESPEAGAFDASSPSPRMR